MERKMWKSQHNLQMYDQNNKTSLKMFTLVWLMESGKAISTITKIVDMRMIQHLQSTYGK